MVRGGFWVVCHGGDTLNKKAIVTERTLARYGYRRPPNLPKNALKVIFTRFQTATNIRGWSGETVKISVASKAIATFKQRIREITRRAGGRGMVQIAEQLGRYLPGWKGYFRLAQTPTTFRDLDSWIRRRLRAVQLKQWKRGTTIYRKLRGLGASHEVAAQVAVAGRRWWHCSRSNLHRVLTVTYFDSIGIPRLT